MINWALIDHFEGARRLKGYVPAPDRSQSGVTIATGFDLGARNRNDLVKLGLPESLVERFTPYLGFKRYLAQDKLDDLPLSITEADARLIDQAVRIAKLRALEAAWIEDTQTLFSDLPNGVQTVIASVSFQYGSLAKRCPKFWRACTSRDWGAAVKELLNFGDDYKTRRQIEGGYLWGATARGVSNIGD